MYEYQYRNESGVMSGCAPMAQDDRERVIRDLMRLASEGKPLYVPRAVADWRRVLLVPSVVNVKKPR